MCNLYKNKLSKKRISMYNHSVLKALNIIDIIMKIILQNKGDTR